jgi:predicted membrane protein
METQDSKQVRPGLKHKSLAFGIIVLTFGFIWLLRNFGMINDTAWDHIISWQMLLIAIGVINLSNGRGRGFGVILILVGGFFLLSDIYSWPITFTKIFWPSLLILIGLFMLTGSKRFFRRRHLTIHNGEDFIEEINVFSGSDRVVHSKSFTGGKVISVFGGSKLDFTHTILEPGIHEMEVVSVFGGSSLIVPSDWNVKVEIFSIFGAYEDKRVVGQIDFSKTLILRGVAIFGGGDIKSV